MATTRVPRLRAQDVAAHRGSRQVLHGVSLAVGAGEAVALIGPNAAGKSTLLRVLAGLMRPSAGSVFLDERPLATLARDAMARTMALVSPDQEGFGALTVRDRVALGRYPYLGPLRPPALADLQAVERALALAGIAHLAERRLATLSAGEKQLSALARALAQEPRVLLLDEPAAHLDVGHALQLFAVLDQIRAGGVAVLAVIHDLARAAAWAERALLLVDGTLAGSGTPREVLTSEACARAFGVAVRLEEGASGAHYRFELRQ